MRKKILGGKRVLALALALSMAVSQAAFAAPDDVDREAVFEEAYAQDGEMQATADEAAAEEETPAATDEAANLQEDAMDDPAEAGMPAGEDEDLKASGDGEDDLEALITETDIIQTDISETGGSSEEEEVAPEEAASGTPSKVIGVQGYTDVTSADAQKVVFSWNTLSMETSDKVNAKKQEVKVGYEVKSNVEMKEDIKAVAADKTEHALVLSSNVSTKENVKPGQKVTCQVRGIYYVYDDATDQYMVEKIGPWSEEASYTFSKSKVPDVTGVSVSLLWDSGTRYAYLTWNPVLQASYYYIRVIKSKTQLNVSTANFKTLYDSMPSDDRDYNSVSNTYYRFRLDDSHTYYYFAVIPGGTSEDALYYNENTYGDWKVSNVVSVTKNDPKAPTVTNVRAEMMTDGKIRIGWDKISCAPNVNYVIYYAENPTLPAYFNYDQLNVKRKSGSYFSSMGLTTQESKERQKVKTLTYGNSANNTEGYITSTSYLIPGKTYYFFVYTYVRDAEDAPKETPIMHGGTAYDYYNTFSAQSNVVSAHRTLGKPGVYTYATRDSIKLTITTNSSEVTGFEIQRKSGKKFKKLAKITDDVYLDAGLKPNTKYVYRVRSYYYNPDSKLSYTGKWKMVEAKTADAANLLLDAVQTKGTSVKLKWNKVPGAIRYEIYRTSVSQADTKQISQKNDRNNNSSTYMYNNRYELLKTINGSKVTSYRDKGLTAGESYTYLVVAYYKTGTKTEQLRDSDTVTLEVGAPHNITAILKGGKVKVSWEPDKYAKKYEIKYTIFDKNGYRKTDLPVKTSTTKTSVQIALGAGEKADIYLRALGKDNTYSDWVSFTSNEASLPAVKGVKAVNTSTKLASGETVKGVKISWKAVSGAKYYKVYRSTREGSYDQDYKIYREAPQRTLIAAESNDNYTANVMEKARKTSYEVMYEKYFGENGSVTGTSAVDYSTDLQSGVTYYYTVVAYGEKGSSLESFGTTKAAKVTFDADVSVKLKNAKSKKVTVSYKKVKGAKKYVIMRADKKKGTYKQIGSTKKTSYTDSKVSKGKTYYYKVVATGTNGLKADMAAESAAKSIKVKK